MDPLKRSEWGGDQDQDPHVEEVGSMDGRLSRRRHQGRISEVMKDDLVMEDALGRGER